MKKTFITLASVTALTTLANSSAYAADIKVKEGQSLENIAEEYGTSVSEIKTLNNINADITVGQTLKVLENNIYTIQNGDTLNKIAKKFDVNVSELKEWNNLSSDLILVGDKLTVSAGTTETVEATETTDSSRPTAEPTSLTVNAPDASTQEDSLVNNVFEQISYSNVYNNEDSATYAEPTFNADQSTQNTTPVSYSRPQSGGGSNLYTSGQCTYYAFSKRPDLGNTWGNANNWANAASQAGYTVNNSPAAGSILQSTAGGYGHVAYVDRVNADGSIQVSEMNYQGVGVVSSRTISASAAGSYNYIH